jgi:hypothetical protein
VPVAPWRIIGIKLYANCCGKIIPIILHTSAFTSVSISFIDFEYSSTQLTIYPHTSTPNTFGVFIGFESSNPMLCHPPKLFREADHRPLEKRVWFITLRDLLDRLSKEFIPLIGTTNCVRGHLPLEGKIPSCKLMVILYHHIGKSTLL